MKKIAVLCLLIACVSCKKDPFCDTVNDLKALDLPQEVLGKWRWIFSSGGFGGWTTRADSTKKFVLTMNADKTYQWCENNDCQSAKWFFGSKTSSNGRDEAKFLVFESLKRNTTPFGIPVSFIQVVNDTLDLGLYCNDCMNPTFVKTK